MKVLVAHPGRQHSHQLAMALQSDNLLAGYWTGLPCAPIKSPLIPGFIEDLVLRHGPVALRPEFVKWLPIAPLLRKTGDALCGMRGAKYAEYCGYALFDKWVARELVNAGAAGVVGYENSASRTFRTAKQLGLLTVLDAASIHHSAQDKFHTYVESQRLHMRINKQKDDEILMADHILTVSELARQTYIDGGVPPEKIHSVMLGADIDLFAPAITSKESLKGDVRFIFVGSVIYRKGIDILLDAFDEVVKTGRATLRIVGGAGEALTYLKNRLNAAVTYGGLLSQKALVAEYQSSDCFVLPSRDDSYGMVVAEALACGVPVIVSDMVGAKDLVEEHKNGWVVPAGNIEKLTERMLWCVMNPISLRRMRTNARESAMQASWQSYQGRVLGVLKSLIQEL